MGVEEERSGDRRPFEVAPRELRGAGSGCSRMALAGCAAVLVLVGLGVLALMLKANDVVRWSLGQVRSEVVRTLPDDLPVVERQRLAAAFEAVDRQLEDGALDPLAFQGLQQELLRFARLGRAPSAEEVEALAEALERFSAPTREPPAPPAPGTAPDGEE